MINGTRLIVIIVIEEVGVVGERVRSKVAVILDIRNRGIMRALLTGMTMSGKTATTRPSLHII